MRKLKLREAVTVRGLDYWNRESWIKFSPHNQPGWWWDTGNDLIPIDINIVDVKESVMVQYLVIT